jgi:hypothetical protein
MEPMKAICSSGKNLCGSLESRMTSTDDRNNSDWYRAKAEIRDIHQGSGDTQNVLGQAISSNFDRRVRVVGGCRESRLSPDTNRNSCDRQWMSSSIQVISKDFFRNCKSFSSASPAFLIARHLRRSDLKPAHNYLNLPTGHFVRVA